MSGAGSLIYPAMRRRKTCMRSMKQQTAIIGWSLQNAASRNFKKAAQRGNVSKRGNLSLPCPNPSQISMSQTSCYSCSQSALRKSMGWSAYRLCSCQVKDKKFFMFFIRRIPFIHLLSSIIRFSTHLTPHLR